MNVVKSLGSEESAARVRKLRATSITSLYVRQDFGGEMKQAVIVLNHAYMILQMLLPMHWNEGGILAY